MGDHAEPKRGKWENDKHRRAEAAWFLVFVWVLFCLLLRDKFLNLVDFFFFNLVDLKRYLSKSA